MKSDYLTFFVGSYTEYLMPGFGGIGRGIYTVQLNYKTGKLNILHSEFVRNPSYLALSDDNAFLYCITEVDQKDHPKVKAFRITDDARLEFLNEQDIIGGFPCHLVVHNSQVLVACYMSGNVLQFPIDNMGALKVNSHNYRHQGSSIHAERQEAPHAHQVVIHPNGRDIYVCDLGIDMVKGYKIDNGKLTPTDHKDCRITIGGGPRHMIFNETGSLAYVLNELSGNISVLENQNDTLKELRTYSSLPKGYLGVASGSAIRLHPDGRFLYAADRALGAITIFRITSHALDVLDYQYTDGEEIREFNITPDGRWLIACHQKSHDTVVYNIQNDGKLAEIHRTREILSPVCVVFPN